jgi:hypothetical protein
MGAKSDSTYSGAVHGDATGTGSWVVENVPGRRGVVNFTDSAGLQVAETECAPALLALAQAGTDALANVVASTAPDLLIAFGTVVLGGSNPTVVVTGLATIVGGLVVSQQATAPGLDPTTFTCAPDATPGSLDIFAWKPTDVTHPALVASTNNAVTVAWVAWGIGA